MPKLVKGNVGRKPPESLVTHDEIDAWMNTVMPHLQPIVHALDTSIRAAVPGLLYAVKYKRAFYGLPELGWIIELAPYDVSVNVLFFGGADFNPPPKLGHTDRTRYVKVASTAEATHSALLDWTHQAGLTPGWK